MTPAKSQAYFEPLTFFRPAAWQHAKMHSYRDALSRFNYKNFAIKFANHFARIDVMDAEQINSIGSHLVDLTARTLDLRGYL